MVSVRTVCMLGPKRSGKTALLQTFIDCVENGGHGYNTDISIRSIDKSRFNPETELGILPEDKDYLELKSQFFTVHSRRQTDAIQDFFFAVKVGNADTRVLQVIDAPGEYGVREGHGAQVELAEIPLYFDKLRKSDAAVVVVPLVADLRTAAFTGRLKGAISWLTGMSEAASVRRIIVAFTQYEKLFVHAGRDAFFVASQREPALEVVRRALSQGNWADGLETFEKSGGSVYFAVTSSFGFVKGFGLPNIDPHAPLALPNSIDEQLFWADQLKVDAYWRPFLTADPFICATYDKPGHLTFTFGDVDPPAKETPQDGPPKPELTPFPPLKGDEEVVQPKRNRPRLGPFLQQAADFLNKNRE
jgi:hypothetical protein